MGRLSNSFRGWLLLALAPAFGACGESRHTSNPASAGKDGGHANAGISGTSGASPVTAGRGSAQAGTSVGGRAGSGSGGGASGGIAGGGSAGVHGGSAGISATAGAGGAGRGGASGTSGGGDSGHATGGGGASAGTAGDVQGFAGEGGEGGDGSSWTCTVGAPAQSCAVTTGAYNGETVVDFALYSGDGKWGAPFAGGITGKTTRHHSAGAPNLAIAAQDGKLHVTGTIPPHERSGWTFRFDTCVTPSVNYGFRISSMGDLDGALLSLTVPINADYPIDLAQGRGACPFTSCETANTECKSPVIDVPVANPAFSGWEAFSGGVPVSGLTNLSEMLALQFDLNCPGSSECAVNLTFTTLEFFSL